MKNINRNIITKLNNQKQSIEGYLTDYECSMVLKEMKNNKCPGSDGITTEFYELFWNDIKMFYVKSLNYLFDKGDLTTLQKQGIISLLPKKDKDLSSLNNWRPLILLKTDYKIAIKTIANRIKQFLPKLIDSSQTGFIKGQYIGENIRLIQETIGLQNGLNRAYLGVLACFKMPFLMFMSILVFRPEGKIWNPVRQDTKIYVWRILNASRISKTQLNSSTISPS